MRHTYAAAGPLASPSTPEKGKIDVDSGVLEHSSISIKKRLQMIHILLVSFISVTNNVCIVRVMLSEAFVGSGSVGGWIHGGSGKSRIRLSSSRILAYVGDLAANAVVMTACMSFANRQVHTWSIKGQDNESDRDQCIVDRVTHSP